MYLDTTKNGNGDWKDSPGHEQGPTRFKPKRVHEGGGGAASRNEQIFIVCIYIYIYMQPPPPYLPFCVFSAKKSHTPTFSRLCMLLGTSFRHLVAKNTAPCLCQ